MNELTLSFGGISRRRCTWSGIRCPSTISTPLYLQSSFMISFRSFRYWPYISFRLYFGVNTTWYVQYHFVCDSELALWAMRHHRSFLFAVTWTLTIIEGTVMFLCNFLVIHPHSGWFIVSRTTYAQLSKDSIQALLVLQSKGQGSLLLSFLALVRSV